MQEEERLGLGWVEFLAAFLSRFPFFLRQVKNICIPFPTTFSLKKKRWRKGRRERPLLLQLGFELKLNCFDFQRPGRLVASEQPLYSRTPVTLLGPEDHPALPESRVSDKRRKNSGRSRDREDRSSVPSFSSAFRFPSSLSILHLLLWLQRERWELKELTALNLFPKISASVVPDEGRTKASRLFGC